MKHLMPLVHYRPGQPGKMPMAVLSVSRWRIVVRTLGQTENPIAFSFNRRAFESITEPYTNNNEKEITMAAINDWAVEPIETRGSERGLREAFKGLLALHKQPTISLTEAAYAVAYLSDVAVALEDVLRKLTTSDDPAIRQAGVATLLYANNWLNEGTDAIERRLDDASK